MKISKSERNVKFLTILAVIVLFVLVLTLVTMLIQKGQLERRRTELQAQIEYYRQLKVDKEDELALRQTYEWLEQQARELGMISQDETLFQVG